LDTDELDYALNQSLGGAVEPPMLVGFAMDICFGSSDYAPLDRTWSRAGMT
jgi:hypothetical protein